MPKFLHSAAQDQQTYYKEMPMRHSEEHELQQLIPRQRNHAATYCSPSKVSTETNANTSPPAPPPSPPGRLPPPRLPPPPPLVTSTVRCLVSATPPRSSPPASDRRPSVRVCPPQELRPWSLHKACSTRR